MTCGFFLNNYLFKKKGSERDAQPIQLSEKYRKCLKKLLLRTLNKNQIIILEELAINGHYLTVTNFLETLSENKNIPLSTLRWNIKTLEKLGLVSCGSSKNKGIPVKLIDCGLLILKIIKEGENNG